MNSNSPENNDNPLEKAATKVSVEKSAEMDNDRDPNGESKGTIENQRDQLDLGFTGYGRKAIDIEQRAEEVELPETSEADLLPKSSDIPMFGSEDLEDSSTESGGDSALEHDKSNHDNSKDEDVDVEDSENSDIAVEKPSESQIAEVKETPEVLDPKAAITPNLRGDERKPDESSLDTNVATKESAGDEGSLLTEGTHDVILTEQSVSENAELESIDDSDKRTAPTPTNIDTHTPEPTKPGVKPFVKATEYSEASGLYQNKSKRRPGFEDEDILDPYVEPGQRGKLYIVSTPIGNPDDITRRAVKVLGICDLVVCEELKDGAALLHKLGLSKDIDQLNEQNEIEKAPEILSMIRRGKKIGLICDGGTPLMADPGNELMRIALESKVDIEVVPGVTSIMAALVRSGFSLDSFVFAGFLPRERSDRESKIRSISSERRTTVLLETPYRLRPVLEAFAKIIPERKAYIGMNLTMHFESHHYGSFAQIWDKFKESKAKGEFVIVFEGSGGANSGVGERIERAYRGKSGNLADQYRHLEGRLGNDSEGNEGQGSSERGSDSPRVSSTSDTGKKTITIRKSTDRFGGGRDTRERHNRESDNRDRSRRDRDDRGGDNRRSGGGRDRDRRDNRGENRGRGDWKGNDRGGRSDGRGRGGNDGGKSNWKNR